MAAQPAPVDLAQVRVPLVVGRGSEAAERHRRGAEALAAAVPHSQLVVVEGAGHGAHRSHPQRFAELVRRSVGLS
jgi:pimeloyl-ACP methyl ester carboxylesterase